MDAHTPENGSIDLAALMASAFHELKNTIGHLTLTLDEAADRCSGCDAELADARTTCHRVSDRLVQLLTLYKSDADSLRLNVEAHSPADFIAELAAEATTLCGDRARILVDSAHAPPFWFFDRYLVAIALNNAVHNALTHGRDEIHLSARAIDGELWFEVADNGPGFPDAILATGGHLPARSERGTGLGLYFAHVVARAHHNHGKSGDLQLANAPGARVRLTLP
jgi:signal transduction histidine kinase